MVGYSLGIALILGLMSFVVFNLHEGPGLWWDEPLVAGLLTGWVVGDVPLGLSVGATLTLLSLGLWTYGGATIPDFFTGTIVGTAVGALGGGLGAGLAVGIPTALLMTQADILSRGVNTVFIHGADHFADFANTRGITLMHMLGLVRGFSRAIPVFVAIWLGAGPIQSLIKLLPANVEHAMQVAGIVLPALGFALLLTMLPLKRLWPFLLVGFILFAYLQLPIIGIALLGVAIAFTVDMLRTRRQANA